MKSKKPSLTNTDYYTQWEEFVALLQLNDTNNEMQNTPDAICKTSFEDSERNLLEMRWKVGEYIFLHEQIGEKRAPYGDQLLQKLSVQLTDKFGRGFSESQLAYMRKLFLFFPELPASLPNIKLTWSHYLEILKTKSIEEIQFYHNQTIKDNWSVRQLKQQIKNSLYYDVSITAWHCFLESA